MTKDTRPSTSERTDRLSQAAEQPFGPASLVGSFFLGTANQAWQGCVVAEIQPGLYLVELFSWMMGESLDQKLVPIDSMASWTFYDSADWMVNAYEHGVSARWEQERADTPTIP